MTDLRALDERIVAEELARLREEAKANEIAGRLYRVAEEAVTARYAALARIPVARLVWSRG